MREVDCAEKCLIHSRRDMNYSAGRKEYDTFVRRDVFALQISENSKIIFEPDLK